jgi:hypothetical protein
MEVLSYLIAQKDSTLNEEEIKKRLYRTAKNKSIEIMVRVSKLAKTCFRMTAGQAGNGIILVVF